MLQSLGRMVGGGTWWRMCRNLGNFSASCLLYSQPPPWVPLWAGGWWLGSLTPCAYPGGIHTFRLVVMSWSLR